MALLELSAVLGCGCAGQGLACKFPCRCIHDSHSERESTKPLQEEQWEILLEAAWFHWTALGSRRQCNGCSNVFAKGADVNDATQCAAIRSCVNVLDDLVESHTNSQHRTCTTAFTSLKCAEPAPGFGVAAAFHLGAGAATR